MTNMGFRRIVILREAWKRNIGEREHMVGYKFKNSGICTHYSDFIRRTSLKR